MVKWCRPTFASEYNMLVLSANDITFLYSCYLENNPSSNDIIHNYCCQLFSNYLRECVVFLSMLMLMPLLSVEVLLCTCLYNDNHVLQIYHELLNYAPLTHVDCNKTNCN